MSLTTLKTRCLIKTRYTGAHLCCSSKSTAVIRHFSGTVYRACTKHTRMAFDGLIDGDGVVFDQPRINKLKKEGKIPPAEPSWHTIDPD